MKRRLPVIALLLAASYSLPAPSAGADDKSTPVSDQTFVQMASAAGLAEVNLGKMAAERASRAEVKKFGQQMVEDHTKANNELLRLADRKKLPPAQTMDRKHEEAADRLARLQGDAFDREYMDLMVKDHVEAVDLFTNESKNGKDQDLKAFATKTLPTLKEHLQMAQDLSGKPKGKTNP